MDELNALEKWVVKTLIEKFKGMQGDDRVIYTGDIIDDLFIVEISNESYTCLAYYASEWIKHFFEEIGEVVEEAKAEGVLLGNPFTSPESFQLNIILYMADYLLWRSKTFRAIERVEDGESTPQAFTVSRVQAIIDDFTELLEA